MQLPDWRGSDLNEGVVREPTWDADHIVLWLPGNRLQKEQEWERISSVPRTQIQIEPGIGTVSATAIRARQPLSTFLGKLLGRFRKPGDRSWTLPNGQCAEQVGERR